jgi:Fe-S cluster assembly protein SufD
MNAERQYIDIFSQQEEVIRSHAPECMNVMRAQALADFGRLGFPSLKEEDYRYTDVPQVFAPDYGLNLNRLTTFIDPAEIFRCDVPNMSTQLYFVVNDSFYKEVTPASSLPKGVYAGGMKTFAERYPDVVANCYGKLAKTSGDSITAFNTLFVQDGFVLYVPRDVKLERPVQLVNTIRSHVDVMANRRILVIIEPHSEARLLVCDHSMDNVKSLATQVVEIFVGEGAYFDYYDLEESTVTTTRFSSLYVEQKACSNVLVNGITLNNGLTRNNYRIALNGEGAETTLCGMAIQDKNQQVDTYTHISHAMPRCKSTELFKNVLDDHAVGVFSGRILVNEGAQKTEAFQTNRNMCLTRNTRMYSKPQLEIYADDVKCSHGMTTGQLDEQALFYMRSRGISREEARTLLSVAFTSDVIENVRLTPLKDCLHYLVEKRFRGELAQCSGCRTICR